MTHMRGDAQDTAETKAGVRSGCGGTTPEVVVHVDEAAGWVDVRMFPALSTARQNDTVGHEIPPDSAAGHGWPVSSHSRVAVSMWLVRHVRAPPFGCCETWISPASAGATHSVADGHETP